MKKPTIRKRIYPSGNECWQVDLGMGLDSKGNRKRLRESFATKTDAEEFAKNSKKTRQEHGATGIVLNRPRREEVRKAYQLLEGTGSSLTEAVAYYLKHAKPKNGTITSEEFAKQLVEIKRKTGRKPRYVRALRVAFGQFNQCFGSRNMNEIAPEEIDNWLDAKNYQPVTRNNYLRDIGILFEAAVKKGFCPDNPVKSLERSKVPEKETEILTPDQALIFLRAAWAIRNRKAATSGNSHDLVPATAIGLFAGLRTSELEKLDWSAINLRKKRIKVEASSAKSAQTRYVDIPDNLHAWLKPLEQFSGPITPPDYEKHRRLLWRTIHSTPEDSGESEGDTAELTPPPPWPRNCLRHSYGSFHYEHFGNANETAKQMGHSSTKMIFQHYRNPVDPDDAAQFWNIRPSKKDAWKIDMKISKKPQPSSKVIPFDDAMADAIATKVASKMAK